MKHCSVHEFATQDNSSCCRYCKFSGTQFKLSVVAAASSAEARSGVPCLNAEATRPIIQRTNTGHDKARMTCKEHSKEDE